MCEKKSSGVNSNLDLFFKFHEICCVNSNYVGANINLICFSDFPENSCCVFIQFILCLNFSGAIWLRISVIPIHENLLFLFEVEIDAEVDLKIIMHLLFFFPRSGLKPLRINFGEFWKQLGGVLVGGTIDFECVLVIVKEMVQT